MSANSVEALNTPHIPPQEPPAPSLARGTSEGDLLSLPFDQYGRMRVAQELALTLHGEIARHVAHPPTEPFTLRVLDVGGYPGVLPHFLQGDAYDVSVLDVVPDDGTIPGYRQGSGLDLPYEGEAFHLVTGLDTLEHIPAGNRDRFIAELMRVARYAVVLINPVQSLEADLAEETLDEYIRLVLDARQEQLAEHRLFGLPDFAATVEAFGQAGWRTVHFPIANVYNWLLMMVAKHYLISLRSDAAADFERTLDRFYNLTLFATDRTPPAYRGVVVAVRPGLEPALKRIEELYPSLPASEQGKLERLQLVQLLMSMIDMKIANHEDRRLREQLEARDKHISGMEARVALLEAELHHLAEHDRFLVGQNHALDAQNRSLGGMLKQQQETHEAEFAKHRAYIARLEEEQQSKNEHILYLEKLLQGIEAGRVMRLTRALSRFLWR